MIKYTELNKTEQRFVMETNCFSIDEEDNIIDSNGKRIEDHLDIMREMESY